VHVFSVDRAGDQYIVETDSETYRAEAVVVASGFFARPKIPASGPALAPAIVQVHSSEYTNPDALPSGAVLVVGSAQSGPQIAEDLFEVGRDVYLSTSRTGRFPRRYRGKDGVWWALQAGVFDVPVERLSSPDAKFAASRQVSGTRGGHTTNLHQFAQMRIRLLGHYQDGDHYRLSFAQDLHANLAGSDELTDKLTKQIDDYIERVGLDVPARSPENTDDYEGDDGFRLPEETDVDLRAAGIRSIVWATGFVMDYAFVHVPVFDSVGYPIQRRGVSTVPGLYFMGIHFQHTAKSDLFLGVGEDAAYVATSIAKQLRGLSDRSGLGA
jgi:putative flavoprotein involved in K+ transport